MLYYVIFIIIILKNKNVVNKYIIFIFYKKASVSKLVNELILGVSALWFKSSSLFTCINYIISIYKIILCNLSKLHLE